MNYRTIKPPSLTDGSQHRFPRIVRSVPNVPDIPTKAYRILFCSIIIGPSSVFFCFFFLLNYSSYWKFVKNDGNPNGGGGVDHGRPAVKPKNDDNNAVACYEHRDPKTTTRLRGYGNKYWSTAAAAVWFRTQCGTYRIKLRLPGGRESAIYRTARVCTLFVLWNDGVTRSAIPTTGATPKTVSLCPDCFLPTIHSGSHGRTTTNEVGYYFHGGEKCGEKKK